ncbi:DUF924 family protein [uncultured Erythrobacter sp.]|uniref:DUF924 family protein n=1 Tax=uncultured Erythrobacter sp. TaxID=263913 RepID=UPI002607EA0D|nr:DUF924 family protein [uncultured Erythrobacter sp.]
MSDALPNGTVPAEAMEVLHFWFLELMPENWFGSSDDVDRAIADRFSSTLSDASEGKCAHWAETPRGLLALVIVLDQFPRNIHRGTALAFAHDRAAQILVAKALDMGWDKKLGMDERQFLYLPLMHAEDRDLQQLCVEKFEALASSASGIVGFAERHRDIVARFGRFPYRNDLLGRDSTLEERDWIAENGNPFG